MSSFKIGLIALILATAIGISGCANDPVQLQGASTSVSAKNAGSGTVIEEPLASLYRSQQANQRPIHDAIQLETQRCMKAKGFTYTPIAFGDDKVKTLPRRIGGLAYAKREGFGIASRAGKPKNPPPDSDTAGMSEKQKTAFSDALNGKKLELDVDYENDPDVVTISTKSGMAIVRKSGCFSQAEAIVGGDFKKWRELPLLVEELVNQVDDEVGKDPRYIDIERKWITCMQKAGFGSLTKDDQIDAIYEKARSNPGDLDRIKKEEIAVAVASAQCEKDLGVGEIIKSIQADVEQKVLDENQGLVISWSEMNKAAAKRAKKILGR